MLNKSQNMAVKELKSPLIVVAGPGTGKTTLISHKIKYLIEKKKINEDDILAITFTRKAAQEMSSKVEVLTNKPFFAKTFHEFAMDIIEKYQKEIPDVDRNFKLIDEFEQLLFFLENLGDIDLSSIEIKNNSTLIAYELQSTISKLKDYGICLKEFEKLTPKDFNMKMDVFMAYSKYEIYKKKNNFVDFGDLLLYIKDLLENNSKIRDSVQERYKYVLVDEFQDTNQLQLDIIKLIAKNNITIVGDQKQSIYGFRGANFSNLEQFKEHYPKFKQVYLDENYRCSKVVVENVNKLINQSKEKLKVNLDIGGGVNLVEAKNENSQFNYITKRILEIKENNVNSDSSDVVLTDDAEENEPLTLGILFRRKSELKEVATKLKNLGIEFNSNETQNLFDFDIIKEILSLCEVILNPREANNEIFKLLMNSGISNEVVKKISRQARLNEKSIYKVLKKEDFKDDIYKNEKDHLLKIIKKIDECILLLNSKVSIYALIRDIIFKFNFYNYALISKTNETINIVNNFLEFVQDYHSTHKNNSLERFLKVCKYSEKLGFSSSEFKDSDALDDVNDAVAGRDVGRNSLKIELLTLHSSKGKEFDFCIMPYLNERRFPTSFKRSKFDILEKDDREKFLEEEKRLFFVGVSRTKRELDLISVKRYGSNKTDSKPSKFLSELKLKPVLYDKEYSEFNSVGGSGVGPQNEIKFEVIEKIQKYILDNEYDKAKKEVDILREIFGKKDLNFFIKNGDDVVNPQKQYYLDKLNGSVNSTKENVDFDESKMIYSVSQVKTYQSCPKKYLYSYIYKIPGVSRHYFDFGTSMHTVFEFLLIDIENTPLNPTEEQIEKLFSKGAAIMSREWISKGYDDANQEKEYFKKGIKSIREFIMTQLSLQKANKNRRTVSNEMKFLIEIEGKRIIGFIDRVDKIGKNEYEIIDYKTSNSMETPAQLKKNLQLYVYAVALEKDATIGKLPKSVGLWYLIHDKIASVDVCDIDTVQLKKEMLEAINGIEKKDFVPNPSFFNCKFCDYSDICENKN